MSNAKTNLLFEADAITFNIARADLRMRRAQSKELKKEIVLSKNFLLLSQGRLIFYNIGRFYIMGRFIHSLNVDFYTFLRLLKNVS